VFYLTKVRWLLNCIITLSFQTYKVCLWTLNTVGLSPPSKWLTVLTFDNNVRKDTVPDAPTKFNGQILFYHILIFINVWC